MMPSEPKFVLYILPVEFGTLRRRLFFDGRDDPDARASFREASKELGDIARTSTSFEHFVSNVIERFARAGFRQIAH